jgi:hypothetical protein
VDTQAEEPAPPLDPLDAEDVVVVGLVGDGELQPDVSAAPTATIDASASRRLRDFACFTVTPHFSSLKCHT